MGLSMLQNLFADWRSQTLGLTPFSYIQECQFVFQLCLVWVPTQDPAVQVAQRQQALVDGGGLPQTLEVKGDALVGHESSGIVFV